MTEASATGNPFQLGFLRTAVISPDLRIADPGFNGKAILSAAGKAVEMGARLAVFPELSLTGYTCADLFYQDTLIRSASDALIEVALGAADLPLIAIVGLPLRIEGRLYNCAALLCGGAVLGVVPKSYLPTTQEYYEERWFSRASALGRETVSIGGDEVPAGADLLFEAAGMPDLRIGVEICEDLWTVQPPSGALALAGATVLVNLSASVELLGKTPYRRELVLQQSARCLAAYLYAASGPFESTTDVVFSGHSMIAECGALLAESDRFLFTPQITVADIDLNRIEHERIRNSSFSADKTPSRFRRVRLDAPKADPAPAPLLRRPLARHPFIPSDMQKRSENCREIFAIQSTALARRLAHTGSKAAVIGVSGGLDSTLAVLVASHAMEALHRPPADIAAVVMPGPGSTERTQSNAIQLAEALGCTLRVIRIDAAVEQHLRDIGHPAGLHDITFENAQARERTQLLMDIANQSRGLVIGTGDLSELALGWCTYNGDQMSMYHVNAGVPKTLVRHLVKWCAEEVFQEPAAALLRDICATPISPELLPLAGDATLAQKTEESVGPYELQDFFLFQAIRYGFGPRKVLFLASIAFSEIYKPAEIAEWLRLFYRRFFASQFKRSAMPDGPKVGTVALSPRGDWRMPSDATVAAWLAELDSVAG